MTSILGTEAQQHHCATLQPALCLVNSGSPGRKELIDGSLQPPASVHCWASHTESSHQRADSTCWPTEDKETWSISS